MTEKSWKEHEALVAEIKQPLVSVVAACSVCGARSSLFLIYYKGHEWCKTCKETTNHTTEAAAHE